MSTVPVGIPVYLLQEGDKVLTLDQEGRPFYYPVLKVSPDMTCGGIEYSTQEETVTAWPDAEVTVER